MKNHMGYKAAEFFQLFHYQDGWRRKNIRIDIDTSRNDATIFDVPFMGMPADAHPMVS